MKQYVIAECIDQRTGQRYFPGDTFPDEAEDDQVERLTAAGCLSTKEPKNAEAAAAASAAAVPPSELDEIASINNVLSLRKIAKGEKIDLGDAKTVPAIRAAIRASRSAKAG